MSRIHARRGRVYMGLASDTASAEPLPFISSWTINFVVDKAEVTAMGDSNKVYVSGLPDASGDMSGFYDDATVQTYTAAIDGLPRKAYFYPSTSLTTQYWYGTILPDFAIDGSIDGAFGFKADWNAASAITKNG